VEVHLECLKPSDDVRLAEQLVEQAKCAPVFCASKAITARTGVCGGVAGMSPAGG